MGYLADITKQLNETQDIIFVGTGILLINESNKVLMACRSDNNQWSLPGGSLEVGETLEDCIVRETFEETGVIVSKSDLHLNSAKAIEEPVIKNNRKIHIVSISYWADKYNAIDFSLDSREFTRYSWFSYDELKRLSAITPYAKVAIDEYYK